MAQDYYNLRIINKDNREVLQMKNANGEWLICKNMTSADDEEDIRQFHSILPKFRHAMLKENFDL